MAGASAHNETQAWNAAWSNAPWGHPHSPLARGVDDQLPHHPRQPHHALHHLRLRARRGRLLGLLLVLLLVQAKPPVKFPINAIGNPV